jgi:predicted nucleic acid-binding protein
MCNEIRGAIVLILDTNIVSALVRKSFSVLEQYEEAIDQGEVLGISALTYYEL